MVNAREDHRIEHDVTLYLLLNNTAWLLASVCTLMSTDYSCNHPSHQPLIREACSLLSSQKHCLTPGFSLHTNSCLQIGDMYSWSPITNLLSEEDDAANALATQLAKACPTMSLHSSSYCTLLWNRKVYWVSPDPTFLQGSSSRLFLGGQSPGGIHVQ